MAQLSRPYQIGLLGIVVLAAAWLVLLQGHSSSTGNSSSNASVPTVQTVTTSPLAVAKNAPKASGSKIYKGSAPGIGGLTSAIAKAQGAVNTSQANAKTLEQKSAAASNESAAATHTSSASAPTTTAATPAKAVAPPTSAAKAAPANKTSAKSSTPAASRAGTGGSAVVNQRVVEAQLAQGKIALILFWNPKGADDVAVRGALKHLHGDIAVNLAGAAQVASFGTITRGIQVYGTPTLLVVNKKGQTITLTGLLDAFAIEQAISEARHS